MSAPAPLSRGARLVEMFPVFAALALHAVAHDRAVLAVPGMLVLLLAALRGTVTDNSSLRLLLVGLLGAGAGAGMLLWSEPPPGPVPAPLLSIICGLLLALAVSGAVARSMLYAWIYAWLLGILSLHPHPSTPMLAMLGLLAFGSLGAAILQGRLLRADAASVVGGVAYLALVAGGSAALSRGVAASEGFLVRLVGGTLLSLVDPAAPGGVGLQESITISPRGSVERSSQALLELSGATPGRLRAVVLDRFDGFTWSSSPQLLRRTGAPGPPGADARSRTIEVTLLEPLGGILPVPAGTRAVEGTPTWFLGAGVLRSEPLAARALTVTGDAAGWLLPEEAPGPDVTEVPEPLRGELAPFAAAIVPATGTARARAREVEAYFQRDFEYALETNLSGHGHPLLTLLREKRPAYCIYFASAMAALLRVSGVPARVVGGFVADEQNPITDDIVVRSRDAHAWVEAWLADEGRWETYDPTPSRSRDAALLLDRRPGWVRAAFQAAGSSLRRSWARLRHSPSDFLLHSPTVWAMVLGGLGWLVRRRARGKRVVGPRGAQGTTDRELAAAYRRYLQLLARAGLVPAEAQTDDELLGRLGTLRGAAVEAVARRFVERYREARFRSATLPSGELARALDDVDRTLGRAA